MNIPLEVWREISLYLPLNVLALSKILMDIYDESWFKDKILIKHENCKQYDNMWESLYKRSLKSGLISILDRHFVLHSLNFEGVKIAELCVRGFIILTFDGDLYGYDGTSEIRLIDCNVKDISDDTYIKNHEWYFIYENLATRLITWSKIPFLSVAYTDDFTAAITENTLYCCNMMFDTEEYELNTEHGLSNVKIVYYDYFRIQQIDGSVLEYEPCTRNIEKLQFLIKDIFPGCFKLSDDNLAVFNHDYDRDEDDAVPIIIPVANNKIQNAIDHYDESLLLIEGDIYKYADEILTSICQNAKNIWGRCGRHYLIT